MVQFGVSRFVPTKAKGPDVNIVPIRDFPRRPLGTDKNYPVGQIVILSKNPLNGVEGELWYLAKFSSGVADWQLIGTGSPGGTMTAIGVNGSTVPGTNPVNPNNGGVVFSTGAQVAAGTIGTNVIRTFSDTLNTFSVQIQRSAAVGASASVNNGVSHFDNTKFTVDSDGFVSTSGGGLVTSLGVDASTGPGTDPVAPAAGVIEITGAQVATGTIGANVIRTNSTAANQVKIEIQRTTAVASTDSTKNGVCHFSNSDFGVDSNGFVTFIGSGNIVWQTITASQTLAVNNGYMCISPGAALSLALPATATIGDIIEVTLDGATSFVITQSAGQQIRVGNVETTLGAGGTLTTLAAGDWLQLTAQSATRWNGCIKSGNFTVV